MTLSSKFVKASKQLFLRVIRKKEKDRKKDILTIIELCKFHLKGVTSLHITNDQQLEHDTSSI
jgi:hypothetical protein